MVALGEKDFILHPICVVPPERHYNSCKELKDDLKWFEKSRAYFYKLSPEYKPKEGLFEQIKLAEMIKTLDTLENYFCVSSVL
ncbi:hypothetical protein [Segatella copri]|jgi:transposase|uniref:hypothetical protein n=1 Tax=Segatella copri TaxID=165179 RepID=UPI002232091C|nr:hypothetical protein [Segatella copri]MCW4075021.1 hypothetical protein [Segatella copri]